MSPNWRHLFSSGERFLGSCNDGSEGSTFVHRQIGHHLAVQFDPGQLRAVHELRIGQPFGAHGGVDSLDPQGTEIPLLHLAVAIGVLPGLLDGLAGDANRVLATAAIALRLIQDPLLLGAGVYTAFDAWPWLVLLSQLRP